MAWTLPCESNTMVERRFCMERRMRRTARSNRFAARMGRGALMLLCSLAQGACAAEPQATASNASDAGRADAKDGSTDGAVVCAPLTCAQAGAQCGSLPDGCGGVLTCGACSGGTACGGGGPNLCGSSPCTVKTCAEMPGACGLVSNGCSELIDCGACPTGATCGGGGQPGMCGCPKPNCAAAGVECGSLPDGCGGSIDCGTCTAPKTCGGGGVPNKCGCTPKTCGNKCGTVSDGCGGSLTCTCSGAATCKSGTCCAPDCSGASCGDDDGCGSPCDGDCPWSKYCNSSNECQCGPSPDFKLVSGTCRSSCGQYLSHKGWNNVGGGCCSSGCAAGMQASSQNETWDCTYCCENFTGTNACQ